MTAVAPATSMRESEIDSPSLAQPSVQIATGTAGPFGHA